MAKVKEIIVCGNILTNRLPNACREYIGAVKNGTDRPKLNFIVELDNGEVKHITFRQEDDGIHVYGDFEGMTNALEYERIIGGSKND